jgi:hypothetical protein
MQRCKKKSVYIFIPLIDNEKQLAISVSRLDIEIKQPSIPTDQEIPPDSPVYKQTARFIVFPKQRKRKNLSILPLQFGMDINPAGAGLQTCDILVSNSLLYWHGSGEYACSGEPQKRGALLN